MKSVTNLLPLVCLLVAGAVIAQDAGLPPDQEPEHRDPELPYSPYATGTSATRVFWGDTHLHTSFSMDAGAFGNRLGLDEAYRFARGEEVESTTAGRARLARPLDFLVIADHSDNMGFFPDLNAGNPELLADPTGKDWYDRIQAGEGMAVAFEVIDRFSRATFPEALMYRPDSPMYRSAWDRTIDRFTAFIGYEWTSQVPPGQNLHRVIIYKEGAELARQTVPATTYPPTGSTDPEYLWKILQAYEDKTGGNVLAIAHNGNLSRK